MKTYTEVRNEAPAHLRAMMDKARECSLASHELRGKAREIERMRQALLLQLRANGMSLRPLAIVCGITPQAIASITKAYGKGKK